MLCFGQSEVPSQEKIDRLFRISKEAQKQAEYLQLNKREVLNDGILTDDDPFSTFCPSLLGLFWKSI